MKTNLKITLVGVFSIALGVLALVVYPIEESNAFPISIGTKECVCKHGGCYDQNVISFRQNCGRSEGGTDTGCSMQYDYYEKSHCGRPSSRKNIGMD